MNFTDADHQYMRRAVALARSGLGPASPNPSVGCVLARQGEVVGQGATQPYGGPHAEPTALAEAGEAARGATAYVTLMPCAHHGKTPPCTEALIRAGVERVVVALDDPDPTSRDGATQLRSAGIIVDLGLLASEALQVTAGFIKRLHTGLPFLRLKYAMTLDGKLATASGHSQWISSPESREEVQTLRQESDAVLVGSGTALADDPRLNVRDTGAWQPRRVVLDGRLRLSPQARLFQSHGGEVVVITAEEAEGSRAHDLEAVGARLIRVPTRPAGRLNLDSALRALAELGINTVFCEGGSGLAGSLLEDGLVDEIIAYLAPKLVGGAQAPSPIGGRGVATMDEAWPLTHLKWNTVGPDLKVVARCAPWTWAPELPDWTE